MAEDDRLARKARAEALQRYLLDRPLTLPPTAKKLLAQLSAYLFRACAEGLLATPPADVGRLVQLPEELPAGLRDKVEPSAQVILGGLVDGPKNFGRDKIADEQQRPRYFERDDGAWFDFSFIVIEQKRELRLLGYNLEIRFDEDGERWFRVDLNLPEHHNEAVARRSHCHPAGFGKDENRSHAIAYPVLTPLELLDLSIHGFREPEP